MKAYAREKLHRILHGRPHINEVHIIMDVEKYRHIVELTVRGKNLDLFCQEETADMYTSIDNALSKMERQLRKYKERHLRKQQGHIQNRREAEQFEESAPPEEPQIANRLAMKPMYFNEAILQMKMDEHLFFVFLNAETGEVNLLFRDGDAAIVHLEPKKLKKPGKKIKYYRRVYDENSINPEEEPRLLKKSKIYVQWASPEEALTEMLKQGQKYYFFLNNSAENASMIYRQANGDYAIIEPRE
jgi:putative sigma-54 modulation protein